MIVGPFASKIIDDGELICRVVNNGSSVINSWGKNNAFRQAICLLDITGGLGTTFEKVNPT